MKLSRIHILLTILILTVFVTLSQLFAAANSLRVFGTVYDAKTGDALPEVSMTFTSIIGDVKTVTGSDGSYEAHLPLGTVNVDDEAPESFTLKQNYPNPFNPATTIEYTLENPSEIRLEIFNIGGQLVRTVRNGYESAGVHAVRWDGRNDDGAGVSAGVYMYKLSTGNLSQTKKMTLLDGGYKKYTASFANYSSGASSASKPAFLNYDIELEKDGYANYTESGFAVSARTDAVEKNIYMFAGGVPVSNEITFTESTDIFPNPERGFYAHTILNTLPDQNYLEALRDENITLIYTEVNASEYRETDFTEDYLDNLRDGFDTMRRSGVKCIFNVVYAHNIGEPDASLERVMRHIEQLRPVIADNWDVIYVAKTGFIGPWGEMHSSTNKLTETASMRAILFQMLGTLPEERIVMVRTPIQKLNVFDNEVMVPERAHDGTRLARTGLFNDCFLASSSDYGTYTE